MCISVVYSTQLHVLGDFVVNFLFRALERPRNKCTDMLLSSCRLLHNRPLPASVFSQPRFLSSDSNPSLVSTMFWRQHFFSHSHGLWTSQVLRCIWASFFCCGPRANIPCTSTRMFPIIANHCVICFLKKIKTLPLSMGFSRPQGMYKVGRGRI